MRDFKEGKAEVRQPSRAGRSHGWLGALLIAICWPLNWFLPGVRTHVLFFPLWLGYTLVVDALVLYRSGTSLLTRSPRDFALLFFLSVPAWWLFEVLNWRTGNWEYLGREHFSDLEYMAIASLSFSTVMPAVFATAEFVRTFGWIERFAHGPHVPATPSVCRGLFVMGWVMLSLLLAWPRYAYPLVWLAIVFLLEPLCVWLGRGSLLSGLQRGDWRTVVAVSAGALICGFFWELWNVFSYPKWVYHVPFVDFWYLFEMPLLGYLGYLPFGLELYVLVHLLGRHPLALRL